MHTNGRYHTNLLGAVPPGSDVLRNVRAAPLTTGQTAGRPAGGQPARTGRQDHLVSAVLTHTHSHARTTRAVTHPTLERTRTHSNARTTNANPSPAPTSHAPTGTPNTGNNTRPDRPLHPTLATRRRRPTPRTHHHARPPPRPGSARLPAVWTVDARTAAMTPGLNKSAGGSTIGKLAPAVNRRVAALLPRAPTSGAGAFHHRAV